MQERLQKIIAAAGICSRRQAEEFIRQGKVSVDGQVITDMGVKVDPERQSILFDGKPLVRPDKMLYVLLNKPKGYVTTMRDPQGRPTVAQLVSDISPRLYPVGRLDLDTEGALIMTNDGELTERILHPRFEVFKTYLAKVKGHPDPQKIAMLQEGIEIEDRLTSPAKVRIMRIRPGSTDIEIIIHEGRKRQVRKMFEAVGHRVLELKRLSYGSLQLGKLPSGKYRMLSPQDLEKIFV